MALDAVKKGRHWAAVLRVCHLTVLALMREEDIRIRRLVDEGCKKPC